MTCHSQIKYEINETINFFRGLILDRTEQELAEHPAWGRVRSNLLKL